MNILVLGSDRREHLAGDKGRSDTHHAAAHRPAHKEHLDAVDPARPARRDPRLGHRPHQRRLLRRRPAPCRWRPSSCSPACRSTTSSTSTSPASPTWSTTSAASTWTSTASTTTTPRSRATRRSTSRPAISGSTAPTPRLRALPPRPARRLGPHAAPAALPARAQAPGAALAERAQVPQAHPTCSTSNTISDVSSIKQLLALVQLAPRRQHVAHLPDPSGRQPDRRQRRRRARGLAGRRRRGRRPVHAPAAPAGGAVQRRDAVQEHLHGRGQQRRRRRRQRRRRCSAAHAPRATTTSSPAMSCRATRRQPRLRDAGLCRQRPQARRHAAAQPRRHAGARSRRAGRRRRRAGPLVQRHARAAPAGAGRPTILTRTARRTPRSGSSSPTRPSSSCACRRPGCPAYSYDWAMSRTYTIPTRPRQPGGGRGRSAPRRAAATGRSKRCAGPTRRRSLRPTR